MEIINVMASSLDGRIGSQALEGDEARQQTKLSSDDDQQHLRQLIESADAIVVGASSIRANEECLDHPGRNGKYPTWIIYAQQEIPESFRFWQQDHIPRILISSESLTVPANSGVNIHSFGKEQHPAEYVYHLLIKENYKKVLLFGGGIVNRWFYEKQYVDQLVLTLSPLIIGKHEAPFFLAPELTESINFKLIGLTQKGDYVFLNYRVIK